VDRFATWLHQQDARLGAVVSSSWVILAMAFFALLRRSRGQPVLRPVFADSVASEGWITGGAGLFSTARNCMWVTLTPTTLHVGLHFPWTCLFPRWFLRRCGWEATVPVQHVVRVENVHSSWFGSMVAVSWTEDGSVHSTRLRLRNSDAFTGKLGLFARRHGAALS
jgi:hypothetical protein